MRKMTIKDIEEHVILNGYGTAELFIHFPPELGTVRLSAGLLYASENISSYEWNMAICDALKQILEGDTGNFYEEGEYKNPYNMYYMCPSPLDPLGKDYKRCIICNRSVRKDDSIITTLFFSFER